MKWVLIAKGNPVKPRNYSFKKLELKQVQELDKLCEANQPNCNQVLDTYQLESFMEANANEFEEIKEALTIKEAKQVND